MNFNYNKLRGKIREIYETQESFARDLDISSATLTSKLNNKTYFTQKEIVESAKLLKLEDFRDYFFTL